MYRKGDEMQRTYNLPDELYNRVKKYAEENFIDVTTVLKLALNEYLKNHGEKSESNG